MKFIQKNILLVVITAVVIFGGGFYYLNQSKPEDTKSSTTTTTTQEKKSAIKVTIKSDGKEKSYEVENAVGKTALEVTQEAVSIEKTGEGKDAFITSINGRKAEDSKKEFWKLVINGKDAEVGAGSYSVVENDTLVWEIATY